MRDTQIPMRAGLLLGLGSNRGLGGWCRSVTMLAHEELTAAPV